MRVSIMESRRADNNFYYRCAANGQWAIAKIGLLQGALGGLGQDRTKWK